MANRIFWLIIIWLAIIGAYVILAATMPALNSIVETANASLAASANMSNFPGTQEAVQTAPVWLWFIPGLVGVVTTIMFLVAK